MNKILIINFIVLLLISSVQSSEKISSLLEFEKIERTELARKADNEFWDLIHGTKKYSNFDAVISKLTAAQQADPLDVYTTAHIGFANMWAVSEGIAYGVTPAANAFLFLTEAEQALAVASSFAPDEPRILGFLGYSRVSLGAATQNTILLGKGIADITRSVELWPEWGHFGAAYGIDAQAPFNSPSFQQALTHYWDTLDACANTIVDRTNPDFMSYLVQETLVGPDRACWDSWIAPYNLEGFFLVMGDALVKAGETDIALIIYNNAKLLRHYDSWPFKALLEDRISNVNLNVKIFRRTPIPGQANESKTNLLAGTVISCAVCHRGDANKNYEPPLWVGERANDYLVPFK